MVGLTSSPRIVLLKLILLYFINESPKCQNRSEESWSIAVTKPVL